MGNYNTGTTLDYNDFINDKKEAARQFSEGDKDLEELLNFCFENGIITKACCKGHKKKRSISLPYLAFLFCQNNEIYLQALLYYFQNKNYEINYCKNDNHDSIFIFYENRDFTFSISSSLFKDILTIFKNIQFHRNYLNELPSDLQNFYFICLQSELDNNLTINDYNFGYYNVQYFKKNNHYCYRIVSTNLLYQKYMKKSKFSLSKNGFFELKGENRELLGQKLSILNTYISSIKSISNLPTYSLKNQKVLKI